MLFHLVFLAVVGHIHLAAEDGFEGLLALIHQFSVNARHIIEELLDAEHVAVIGDGHAPHTISNSLVHQLGNARLPVENRIISMNV